MGFCKALNFMGVIIATGELDYDPTFCFGKKKIFKTLIKTLCFNGFISF